MPQFSPKLSMREKSYYKRRMNREHCSNLRAGYVHINEEQLRKTGLRGRKTRFLYIVVSFLILLTLINVGATGVLLCVLRVNTEGVASMKFGSQGEVQFTQGAELDDVFLVQSDLQDTGQGLAIHSVDSGVMLSSNGDGPKLQVNADGVEIEDVESFQVVDPVSGKTVFDTDSFSLPASLNSLDTQDIELTEISSPAGKDLTFFTDGGDMAVTGSMSVTVEGKRVEVSADNILLLDVENLSLSAPGGVYLEQFADMIQVSGDPQTTMESSQLCMCVPSGLVFMAPSSVRCDTASQPGRPHPCDM